MRLRSPLRSRRSSLARSGQVLALLLALLAIWVGAIVVLLALKLEPATVQGITGYASVYDFFRGLTPQDFDATTRRVLAGAGLLCLVVFAYLALKQVPRPYVAREDLDLTSELTVDAGAIEHLCEIAACRRRGIARASGHYQADRVSVRVALGRPRDVDGTLRGVQHDVRQALEAHGLPVVPVDVLLSGYQPRSRREIS